MKPRIVIYLEGGLIEHVTSNQEVEVVILDGDVEGCDESEVRRVASYAGGIDRVCDHSAFKVDVDPELVGWYFAQFKGQEVLERDQEGGETDK